MIDFSKRRRRIEPPQRLWPVILWGDGLVPVASGATALFARTRPDPAVLFANDLALCIQQDKTNRPVCGNFHEE